MPNKEKSAGARRKARRRAFELLYSLSFTPVHDETSLRRAFKQCPSTEEAPEENDNFAWELAFGVWSESAELDEVIVKYSRNWRIARIAKIELTILRLALYEIMRREDIPLRVSINEAVELSKRYGDDNSRNFINGILDAVAKDAAHGSFGVTKEL